MEIPQLKYAKYSLFIATFILNYIQIVESNDTMDKIQAIKNKIFRDYDKTIRPTNGTNTTHVLSSFIPRQIIDLDEEKSLFTLDSYLIMHWDDIRLRWNKSDYDGFIQVPKNLVWVPDINVYNSHSAQVDPTQEVLVALYYEGGVSWFPPILTQTTCSADLKTSYPYDEVECVVIMGSWVHDGWEINFDHNTKLSFDEFENIHPRWELITSKAYVERNETYYECCPEPYLSLHHHFPLRRRPVPEIEATRYPCILIMVLTLTIFWLPPESSKKLLIGGILFISLNVLLSYVAWGTKNPLAVLYSVSFIQTAMYIVVTTILLQVFVVIKVATLTGPSQPPASVVQLLTGVTGKYLLLYSPMPSHDKLAVDQISLNEDSKTAQARDQWRLCASAIDRLLFFLTLFVMIVVHHL